MPITLILDTNVVVAGLRSASGASHSLLRMVGTGVFELGLTPALVLEYECVCLRHLDSMSIGTEDLSALLDYFCRVGRRSHVRFRARPSVVDPGDEILIEAAIATSSLWIVTHNMRHIADGAAPYGIEAVRPGEALHRLEESR